MSRSLCTAVAFLAAFAATTVSSQTTDTKASTPRSLDTTAPVLWQPSMNVFRRFAAPKEKMFQFYGTVLGFRQLTTLNVNTSGGGVARFQAGAQELKLTGRVPGKRYQPGGVRDATGLRLLTFFFADEAVVAANTARSATNVRNEKLIRGSVNHASCRYNRSPCGKYSSSSSY